MFRCCWPPREFLSFSYKCRFLFLLWKTSPLVHEADGHNRSRKDKRECVSHNPIFGLQAWDSLGTTWFFSGRGWREKSLISASVILTGWLLPLSLSLSFAFVPWLNLHAGWWVVGEVVTFSAFLRHNSWQYRRNARWQINAPIGPADRRVMSPWYFLLVDE